jgi:hypothetical protein
LKSFLNQNIRFTPSYEEPFILLDDLNFSKEISEIKTEQETPPNATPPNGSRHDPARPQQSPAGART